MAKSFWVRGLRQLAVPLAVLIGGVVPAYAEYPEQPIQLILPTPPGGVADMNARPVAKQLHGLLKQPVVVVNRPGAGGGLAYSSVAKAKPDGYTLLLGLSTISVLPESDRVNGRVPSFELDQLAPVALVSADPLLLLVRADAPWTTVEEFVDDARKHPGKFSYGSSGNYGAIHFPMEMLANAAGIKLLHVPYTGGGPALMGVMGGQVDVTGAGPAAARAAIAGGKARVLASWGSRRIEMFPEVPTLKEAGINAEYHLWAGLFAPAATPAPVIARLRAAMREAAADASFKEDMTRAGIEMRFLDGPQFATFWQQDADAMIQLARTLGKIQ